MKKLYLTIVLLFGANLLIACGTPASAQLPSELESNQTTGGEVEPGSVQEDVELAPLREIELEPAHRTSGENGERQTYLSEGEAAPFAGVLLNPAAVAFIVSEWEAFQLRAQASLRLQRESDWNRLQLEVGRLQLRINSIEQQHQVVVEGLRRENQRLIQIHEDYVEEQTGGFWNSDFGQVLQYGLIILGSAAVGLVVGFVAGGL